MIITKTPFRISFFGGGTDYPKWYLKNNGAVLSATINKYCYISCRKLPPFFEHKNRLVYSKIETFSDLNQIQHPSVREVLKFLKINDGLEIHHDGDLPSRSGLGSSSSFTVGLIHALYSLNSKLISKKDLADISIHIEQDLIQENVGSQDQIAAAYGGINKINFNINGSFDVNQITLSNNRSREFLSHLMLFFTGVSRYSNEIAKSKIDNIDEKSRELSQLYDYVDDSIGILTNENRSILEFGYLLNESWQLKKSLSNKVSSSLIDNIYERSIKNGALGGKILGAGGGGFMLLFAEPEKHSILKQELKEFVHVDFEFEYTGSKLVVYSPNGL